jgi:hypothetical protein
VTLSKAEQIFFHEYYHGPYIKVKISIWKLPEKNWIRYPIKFKYSLICINTKTGQKVLMDNHHPKGPHVHLDNVELNYNFKDVKGLLVDFKDYCRQHMEIGL